MDLEEQIKLAVPVLNLVGVIGFLYNKKVTKGSFWVILLFFTLFNFSSNFTWVYREISQVVILSFVAAHIRNVVGKGELRLLYQKFFLLFTISVLLSMIANLVFSSNAITGLVNYATTAIVSILVINLFIKERKVISLLVDYLKKMLLMNSLIIIATFVVLGMEARVEHTFSNPNYLSFFLTTGLIFIGFRPIICMKDNFILLVILLAIFATGSRSGLLIALPFYLFIYLRHKPWILMVVLVCCGLFLFDNFDKVLEIGRVKNIGEDRSILQRYEIFNVVRNIFVDKPLFGIGYGRFVDEFKNYLGGSVILLHKVDTIVTHNDYYRILAELGLVGFVVFIGYIIRNVVYLKRIRYYYPVLFMFLLVTSYSFTHNNMNSFLFWLMLSMPYIIYRRVVYEKFTE